MQTPSVLNSSKDGDLGIIDKGSIKLTASKPPGCLLQQNQIAFIQQAQPCILLFSVLWGRKQEVEERDFHSWVRESRRAPGQSQKAVISPAHVASRSQGNIAHFPVTNAVSCSGRRHAPGHPCSLPARSRSWGGIEMNSFFKF